MSLPRASRDLGVSSDVTDLLKEGQEALASRVNNKNVSVESKSYVNETRRELRFIG